MGYSSDIIAGESRQTSAQKGLLLPEQPLTTNIKTGLKSCSKFFGKSFQLCLSYHNRLMQLIILQ